MSSELDELNELLNAWDPIGVVAALKASGQPLTEYISYSPRILSLLRRGSTDDEIASELTRVVSSKLGVPPDEQRERRAAERIVHWYRRRK